MNKTIFYLVRHGQTDWNIEHRLLGHSDIPLNEIGKRQAEELRQTLSSTPFTSVYSSDLQRASETATIIVGGRNIPITADERFREKSFGDFEGKKREEMLKMYEDWEHFSEEQKWTETVGHSESNRSVVTRVTEALREIGTAHENETILITTHGGVIRFLLISLGYGTFESIGGIENCGYIVLSFDGQTFTVEQTVGLKTWKEKLEK